MTFRISALNRVLVLVVAVVLASCAGPNAPTAPRAVAGVLDLSGWDFSRTSATSLAGQWSFQRSELVRYPSLVTDSSATSSLTIPGTWSPKGLSAGREEAFGWGTFQLKVILPHDGTWMLRIPTSAGSYQAFVNGVPVLQRGSFDLQRQSEVIDRTAGYSEVFTGSEVILQVHLANYTDYYGGGFQFSPEIGPATAMNDARISRIVADIFLIGILFIMGFYHLLLFTIQKKEWALLSFGLICLAVLVRQVYSNEAILETMLAFLKPYTLKVGNLTVPVLLLLFLNFFRLLYPSPRRSWLQLAENIFGGLIVAVLVVLPTDSQIFAAMLPAYQGFVVYTVVVLVIKILDGVRRKVPESREILAGTFFISIPSIIDVLTTNTGLLNVYLFPFGLVPFLLTFAYVLVKRYTRELQNSYDESERRLKVTEVYTRRSIVKIIERGDDPTSFLPESKNISVLFSDIRNFTGISETLKPIETVDLLNSYFTSMNERIHHHQGEIDKLIGDCIMALFLKPDDALRAAIDMRVNLRTFNKDRPFALWVDNGIGINYGEVITGNIGSPSKMDYTVIGDIVNSASRIESLTKYYRLPLLISEDFKNQLKGDYCTRFIDVVQVKGRTQPIRLFEVFDFEEESIRADKKANIPVMAELFEAYTAGDFARALHGYLELKTALGPHNYRPEFCRDPVIDFYIDRCRSLDDKQRAGLITNWNGIFEFMEK